MPLISNTNGAIDRTRLADWATLREKVTVVAATDAATTQSADTLAAAGRVIYTMTPTAGRALTTPTGAQLGTAFTDEAVGTSFEFTVVNLAAATHAITLTAGASGVTLVGSATVSAASSATFLGVFTAADTVSIYRK
ncbi:hypothetical protein UFOVP1549_12 [uncultured Caudovirales phage]|uniref:Uncharacterized protein n=1 Tax=uncultured Caudovirales phage TaxID=2100421 RepID=A0A6J5LS03_9CAUD|nr:hypothetical protein UFOVP303_21 [uncultured Caudovirales phage]CAB5228496.1 hypothetical protein UFOVP1549_12 [uncultured Caudovirales phage]